MECMARPFQDDCDDKEGSFARNDDATTALDGGAAIIVDGTKRISPASKEFK